MKNTLILFVAYHDKHFVDSNYVQKLSKINSDFKILSNQKIKGYENVLIYDNEGYDFGFWYKYLITHDVSEYERIILVNNSNVVINGASFDFINTFKSGYDFWGLTDSYENPPGVSPDKSYHIQSHFLVFEKPAIPLLLEFFKFINFENYLSIKDNLRQKIINDCEIGLSQYMLNKGLNIGSVFSVVDLCRKHKLEYRKMNLHVWLWEELVLNKYPLIKKKIIKGEWKFIKNYKNYEKYI